MPCRSSPAILALLLLNPLVGTACRAPSAPANAAQPNPSAAESALAAELVAMGDSEQALRQEIIEQRNQPDMAKLDALSALDELNTKRLIEIVDAYGWPTSARFGKSAASAAWLVLQHSPRLELQQRMLPEIERLMRAGEVRGQEYALLYDRVQMRSGKPQRYGSQFVTREGVNRMYTVEDRERLDALRAEVGLGSIEAYRQQLEQTYGVPAKL